MNISFNPHEYRMTVHFSGAMSSPSSANIQLHKLCTQNIYVDDCLKSVSMVDEEILLIKELTAACQRGGFHLSICITNSLSVLSSIPEADRAKEVKELSLDRDQLPTERALVVQWCVEDANFTLPSRRLQSPSWGLSDGEQDFHNSGGHRNDPMEICEHEYQP